MANIKILLFVLCASIIKLCGNTNGDQLNDLPTIPSYNDSISVDTPDIIDIPEPISIRDSLISIFRSQIGVKQIGDNTGPEVDMYLAAVGLSPGYPWCGAFVGWGYKMLDLIIPKSAAWTPSWFISSKVIDNIYIKRGDVGGIYFSNLGRIAHIFVYEYDWNEKGSSVTTIEGNTNDTGSRVGNAVHRKYRNKNQIHKSANWIDV